MRKSSDATTMHVLAYSVAWRNFSQADPGQPRYDAAVTVAVLGET